MLLKSGYFYFMGVRIINNTLTEVYLWLTNLYTATELKVIALCSLIGAFFSVAVGGIDAQITALIQLVIADYVTGLVAGWKTNSLGSGRGLKGIFKKVAIFAAVALANTVDSAMATHTLRTMAICGFAGVESMSIIENIDRMGYGEYIPAFLRNKLVQIREEKGVKL